ncbi:MAG: ribosome recycling factor [Absicoccus porci]|jgi:ribosome recycling factor|uniref:Ribosome-recycling factor n=1 Tax=Absicoccus porci TaxID=2486576 RepID=A0A3N0HYF9_9FIRM|nr:ribosome recycling factor [Absicoccus porci]MCI6087811.1 ribosome recycling factor [Absicoccus porci]MDD6460039.1 ribosome recycling factor [Absicoccus porci]MDD7330046.1 ribosome recycling factor [Absicoccus porci]MDY4738936.1 ribosome recycling factor [Absicoccus porci]MEE1354167.1 ribosome recycling factor [Absicoccus porci]
MTDILDNAEMKMMAAIENLEENLRTLRTGRANAALLDRVEVDYYGSPTPVNQMARISVVEGTQLVVKPYDRTLVKAIVHAVQAANLGLNPQGEADCVRIQVPQLTGERRQELAKKAQKYGEEAKVAIRNIRREANDAIKKDKELREDEEKSALEDSQKLTDTYIKNIESVVEKKKADILNV